MFAVILRAVNVDSRQCTQKTHKKIENMNNKAGFFLMFLFSPSLAVGISTWSEEAFALKAAWIHEIRWPHVFSLIFNQMLSNQVHKKIHIGINWYILVSPMILCSQPCHRTSSQTQKIRSYFGGCFFSDSSNVDKGGGGVDHITLIIIITVYTLYRTWNRVWEVETSTLIWNSALESTPSWASQTPYSWPWPVRWDVTKPSHCYLGLGSTTL